MKSVHTIIAPAYLDNNLGEAVMSTDRLAKPGNHMPRFSGVLFYFFFLSNMKIISTPQAGPRENGTKHTTAGQCSLFPSSTAGA